MTTLDSKQDRKRSNGSERDVVALGIATAAILLFVGTGGTVMPLVVRSLLGEGNGPDQALANALLLNVALIIFGWRRHRQLTEEIAERRQAEELARQLAETDPLTGCLNRRSLTRATDELRGKAHASGKAVACVLVDIDNFKQINDLNGHTTGDAVLCEITMRLRSLLPPDALLARIGGDEFALMVPFPRNQSERIDDLAIRLIEGNFTPLAVGDISVETTMSIGISSDLEDDPYSGGKVDAQALMHRADIAMYHAKKQGKSRHFWFEPTMENELRFRNDLEKGIRRGIEEGEFVPYYEQQIDLETGELIGFEMLARWNSPNMGVVCPEIFIPIAEEIGVITQLSEQLMVQAFADARHWDPALTLAVNISPLQLRDPWFAQKLLRLMVAHSFPPSRLEIEITESCLRENVSLVSSMISSLRNQGVKVSLDDFGTGYSSLEQLRTLPFDRIKIDRSFIAELNTGNPDSRIVKAIVSLGRGLELPITAEGIENKDILGALKHMGKLMGQGYIYGKPETADQVHERLRNAKRLAANQSVEDSETTAIPESSPEASQTPFRAAKG
ncbi:putative bifunctional diguanylate cyclase/phosphodiesterase [Altererythrobacter sp.]|uniref:putative bifunctional diguanylate cyclase/phosphodiesterase n=1 Tax=Altererythrobacter sp. TaxID=1872480 RepID=UPI003D06358F